MNAKTRAVRLVVHARSPLGRPIEIAFRRRRAASRADGGQCALGKITFLPRARDSRLPPFLYGASFRASARVRLVTCEPTNHRRVLLKRRCERKQGREVAAGGAVDGRESCKEEEDAEDGRKTVARNLGCAGNAGLVVLSLPSPSAPPLSPSLPLSLAISPSGSFSLSLSLSLTKSVFSHFLLPSFLYIELLFLSSP